MITPTAVTQSPIFKSLPNTIQSVLLTYSEVTRLSVQVMIEIMIARFLELDFSALINRPAFQADSSLLESLPLLLQSGIKEYGKDVEMPPEFVIELAIAHFLDPDSVTFDDCQASIQQSCIEQLKQYAQILQIQVA